MKTHIGIDPGKSGGIACISPSETSVWPMPETVADLVDLLREIRVHAPHGYEVIAAVERVHSSPQMGVVSAFTFGRGLGNIEAACSAIGIRLEWVNPPAWQRALGCLTKGDKNVSKRRAQELFPQLKITHAIADALLIAEYARRQEKATP
jgi:crossover junction endodeoxyribonuclease RuvC